MTLKNKISVETTDEIKPRKPIKSYIAEIPTAPMLEVAAAEASVLIRVRFPARIKGTGVEVEKKVEVEFTFFSCRPLGGDRREPPRHTSEVSVS